MKTNRRIWVLATIILGCAQAAAQVVGNPDHFLVDAVPGQANVVDVLANDQSGDGFSLSISSYTAPTCGGSPCGTLTDIDGKFLIYQPNSLFATNAPCGFSYTFGDGATNGTESVLLAPSFHQPVVEPASLTLDMGDEAVFNAVVSGALEPLTYVWYRRVAGNSLYVDAPNHHQLVLQDLQLNDNGEYYCMVYDGIGNAVASTDALLTVGAVGELQVSDTQPSVLLRSVGENASFIVYPGGGVPFDPPPAYLFRWFHDGDLIPSATNQTLDLTNLSEDDAGAYHCEVEDAGGATVSSAPANLVVFDDAPPSGPFNEQPFEISDRVPLWQFDYVAETGFHDNTPSAPLPRPAAGPDETVDLRRIELPGDPPGSGTGPLVVTDIQEGEWLGYGIDFQHQPQYDNWYLLRLRTKCDLPGNQTAGRIELRIGNTFASANPVQANITVKGTNGNWWQETHRHIRIQATGPRLYLHFEEVDQAFDLHWLEIVPMPIDEQPDELVANPDSYVMYENQIITVTHLDLLDNDEPSLYLGMGTIDVDSIDFGPNPPGTVTEAASYFNFQAGTLPSGAQTDYVSTYRIVRTTNGELSLPTTITITVLPESQLVRPQANDDHRILYAYPPVLHGDPPVVPETFLKEAAFVSNDSWETSDNIHVDFDSLVELNNGPFHHQGELYGAFTFNDGYFGNAEFFTGHQNTWFFNNFTGVPDYVVYKALGRPPGMPDVPSDNTAIITFIPVAPSEAHDDFGFWTPNGAPITITFETLIGNDGQVDPLIGLTISDAFGANHGTVFPDEDEETILFTPDPGFEGGQGTPASFRYRLIELWDPNIYLNPGVYERPSEATVYIHVAKPVPVASADTFFVSPIDRNRGEIAFSYGLLTANDEPAGMIDVVPNSKQTETGFGSVHHEPGYIAYVAGDRFWLENRTERFNYEIKRLDDQTTDTAIAEVTVSALNPGEPSFGDDFSSNLDNWNQTVIQGKGSIAIEEEAGLNGSGMAIDFDTATAIYADSFAPGGSNHYWASFHMNVNEMTMAGNDQHAALLFQMPGSNHTQVRLRQDNGVIQAALWSRENGSTFIKGPWASLAAAWNTLTVEWRAAESGSAGYANLWLNGVQVANLANLDNSRYRIDKLFLGAVLGVGSNTSGRCKFDNFRTWFGSGHHGPVLRDDFNGDLSAWDTVNATNGNLVETGGTGLFGTTALQMTFTGGGVAEVRDLDIGDAKHILSRFELHLNGLKMEDQEVFTMVRALGRGNTAFVLQLKYNGVDHIIRLLSLQDVGGNAGTGWQAIPGNAWVSVAFEWWASSSVNEADGGLRLWLDGNLVGEHTDLVNYNHRVDSLRLGAPDGLDPNTQGAISFEQFESWLGPTHNPRFLLEQFETGDLSGWTRVNTPEKFSFSQAAGHDGLGMTVQVDQAIGPFVDLDLSEPANHLNIEFYLDPNGIQTQYAEPVIILAGLVDPGEFWQDSAFYLLLRKEAGGIPGHWLSLFTPGDPEHAPTASAHLLTSGGMRRVRIEWWSGDKPGDPGGARLWVDPIGDPEESILAEPLNNNQRTVKTVRFGVLENQDTAVVGTFSLDQIEIWKGDRHLDLRVFDSFDEGLAEHWFYATTGVTANSAAAILGSKGGHFEFAPFRFGPPFLQAFTSKVEPGQINDPRWESHLQFLLEADGLALAPGQEKLLAGWMGSDGTLAAGIYLGRNGSQWLLHIKGTLNDGTLAAATGIVVNPDGPADVYLRWRAATDRLAADGEMELVLEFWREGPQETRSKSTQILNMANGARDAESLILGEWFDQVGLGTGTVHLDNIAWWYQSDQGN